MRSDRLGAFTLFALLILTALAFNLLSSCSSFHVESEYHCGLICGQDRVEHYSDHRCTCGTPPNR